MSLKAVCGAPHRVAGEHSASVLGCLISRRLRPRLRIRKPLPPTVRWARGALLSPAPASYHALGEWEAGRGGVVTRPRSHSLRAGQPGLQSGLPPTEQRRRPGLLRRCALPPRRPRASRWSPESSGRTRAAGTLRALPLHAALPHPLAPRAPKPSSPRRASAPSSVGLGQGAS